MNATNGNRGDSGGARQAPKQPMEIKTGPDGAPIIPEGVSVFFMSEIVKKPVLLKSGLSIGRIKDVAVKLDAGLYPEAAHLIVRRPWGHPDYWLPWRLVSHINENGAEVEVRENLERFTAPAEEFLPVCDNIIDKKIIDMEDREVEVVYDVQLLYAEGKLFVTHVDAGRSGLLRRVKLGFVNKLLFGKSESPDLVPWQYVHIPAGIGRLSGQVRLSIQREKLKDIHPVDLADIIEELGHEERLQIFDSLDTEKAADTLEEIEPRVQRELISSIRQDRIHDIFNSMTPVQIADLFSALPAQKAERFMEKLDADVAETVRGILSEREEGILSLVSRTLLAFPPDISVDEAFKRFRAEARDMDVIMYIYVVGADKRLEGVIDIRELVQAEPNELLSDIMVKNVISVEPGDTRDDVEEMFNRYHFRAIPVVDAHDRLTGVVRYKDITVK